MSGEIVSLQQLFEVVWQTNRIELNFITIKVLDSAGVDVSMYIVEGVEEVEGMGDISENYHQFLLGELLLAVCLPLRRIRWHLHFNENVLLLNYLIIKDVDYIVVVDLT